MTAMRHIPIFAASLLLLGMGCATTGPALAPVPAVEMAYPPTAAQQQPPGFETPPVVYVPQVLDPGAESSPQHDVADTVVNDGFMHHVTVQTSGATYPAYGVERAQVRIHEIGVTAELDAMRNSEAGGKGLGAGLKSAALGPFRQLRKIARNPLYAVAAVPGSIFKYADLAVNVVGVLRHGVGKEEFKELIGYHDAREDLAKELGVDPYTTNEALRDELDETAWAFYSGGLPVKLVEDFVPGIPKLSLGTGSMSIGSAIDEVRPSSRTRALRRLVPNKEQREAFRAHPWYTPETERRLLNALRTVDEVEGAGAFILSAMDAASEDQAWAFMRTAELLEVYTERDGVPDALRMAGPFPVAQRADGGRALLLYADYVPWTQEFARLLDALAPSASGPPMVVWISGAFSPRTHEELAARGMTVVERAFDAAEEEEEN